MIIPKIKIVSTVLSFIISKLYTESITLRIFITFLIKNLSNIFNMVIFLLKDLKVNFVNFVSFGLESVSRYIFEVSNCA